MNPLVNNERISLQFHRLARVLLLLGLLALSLFLLAATVSQVHADSSDYVEILEGDMPLVFAVGHGGWKVVGDLQNYGPDWVNDPLVQEYFFQILAVHIYERTGHLPYIVYQQGQRRYVNVNQYVGSGQAYHPDNEEARGAYFEFHDQLEDTIARVEAEYGSNMALLINPHSTDLDHSVGGRPWDRITDIGFIASVTNLGSSMNTMKALYDRRGAVALRGEDSISYQLFHAQYWNPNDPPWPPAVITNSKTLARTGDDVWHVLPAFVTGWGIDDWVTAYYNGRTVVLYHGTNTSGRSSYWHNGLDAFQMEVNFDRYAGISLSPYDPGYDPEGPYYQLDVTFTTRFMDDLVDAILYSLEVNYNWTPGGVHNLLVDNGDPGFSTTGTWELSSGEGAWNTPSIWSDQAGATATWTPNITRTGVYQVLIRWTDNGYRTYNAQYTVNYAGDSQTFSIDQGGGRDAKWVSLGYFPFEVGTSGNVVLNCTGTGESTAADATMFRLDEDPPIVPGLLNPSNGAFISDTTPSLTWWSPSLDLAGYLLDWNGSVSDVGPLTQTTTSPLADGVYTWTAAAYDVVGNVSDFAPVYSFTVDTLPPAPPTLISPFDGALISDTRPALTWQASSSPDAAGYRLQWQGSPLDVGNTTQYTTPLLADGVYTWTVIAYDRALNTSPSTDTWSLIVDSTPPTRPVLLSPGDGTLISDTTPTLAWAPSPSPDAAGYLVQWNGVVTDLEDATQYTVTLSTDGIYSWTVAAYDAVYNVSPYTDVWTFTLDTAPPQAPVLLSPPDGTLINKAPTDVSLTWSAGPDPDLAGYWLNWSGTSIDVGATTQHTLTIATDGAYTWTTAAYDELCNTSPYTDTWSLTVDSIPPEVQATYPVNQAIDVSIQTPVAITFSEAVAIDTFDYAAQPDPGGWLATWSEDAKTVTLEHTPFAYQTSYVVGVTAIEDKAGNPMPPPPIDWWFTTEPTPCVEIDRVSLTQLISGTLYVDQPVWLEADLTPDDAASPYTYRPTVDGQVGDVATAIVEPLAFSHTFTTTGTHTVAVAVAVWNCAMSEAQAITDALAVQIYSPGTCIGLQKITISGPSSGFPDTYTFSTSYQPPDASLPISYLWDNGDQEAISTRSLDVGIHDTSVTATNCITASVTDSHTITISPGPTCTEVTSVDLSLDIPGDIYTYIPLEFTADILPDKATNPYHYTLDYGDGSPLLTATASADPLTLSHAYAPTGTFSVKIAVWNCEMSEPVRDTLLVWVNAVGHTVYLPMLLKSD